MTVIDDPVDRLYAGALLGTALAKQTGTVSAQQEGAQLGARTATLEAGIAAGKIKSSSLSPGDAALLGGALTGQKVNVPSLVSNPLGFLGGLGENFAKGAGQFVGSLGGIPQALLGTAENVVNPSTYGAFGTKAEPSKGLPHLASAVAKQIGQDFSSPEQIYKNPFNPILDVATVASGGLGAVSKGVGALARAGKFATDAETGLVTGLPGRIVKITSPLGREPIAGGPMPSEAEQLVGKSLPPMHPRVYSERPFMKYAVQKPLDATISNLARVPFVPDTVAEKVAEKAGQYYGKVAANRIHGQVGAGTNERFLKHPVQDVTEATREMFSHGQAAGQYEWEAMILHKLGINTTDKLDEYVNQIRNGEDVEGVPLTPSMQKMADYRSETLYQDPRFRQLIEKPTDAMKLVAYHLDRANVAHAMQLDIAPPVSEDAAFGRLREMTGKTNDELTAELPRSLQPQNTFAKMLYSAQQATLGEPTADVVPSIQELAHNLPFGSVPEREDILRRAFESLEKDRAGDIHPYDLHNELGYIPGNNIFDKIAAELHDKLGINTEQAQAFTRGVRLGTPEGPIQLGYIPSASGEGAHFGALPEKAGTKVARTLGVGRFRPIGEETAPTYYDVKRPFTPRSASARTIGLPPRQGYKELASYDSFLQGVQRYDPETILRNVYQIQKDLVEKDLNPKLISALAVPKEDGSGPYLFTRGYPELVEKLGDQADHYELVPINTVHNYVQAKGALEIDAAEAFRDMKDNPDGIQKDWEEKAEEAAQRFVAEESEREARSFQQAVAMPKTYVNHLIQHIRVGEQASGIGRFLASTVGRWKTAVLTYMPSWLLRTTVGHGLLALIDGTTNPKYWIQSRKYFEQDRPIMPEHLNAVSWGKRYKDTVLGSQKLPYGVNQGGLSTEMSDVGQGARSAKQGVLPRSISGAVHTQNNFQRRAVYLAKLDKGAKQRLAELGKDFDHPGGFWNSKNIDAVLDPAWREQVLQYPDLVEHAFDQLSHVSYTFGQMSPWERRLVKYAMPFYGWYKFVSKFVWSMPVNYPGRAAALGALGRVGQAEHEELGAMPEYLSGALWLGGGENARYINLYGLNPMADVANPFGHEGVVSGLVRAGQMSPLIQSALAAYGYDPLTGELESIDPRSGLEKNKYGEYIDLKTGQKVAPFMHNPIARALGTFMRAFPELRGAELLRTGGNPVYPESILGVSEHPVAVKPETRRGGNVVSMLEQFAGAQPRNFNLTKFGAKQLKEVREARIANKRTIRKAEKRLAEPAP